MSAAPKDWWREPATDATPAADAARRVRVRARLDAMRTDSWPSVEEALAAGKLAGAAVFEAAARKRSRGRDRS